jgi:hypothetical protein
MQAKAVKRTCWKELLAKLLTEFPQAKPVLEVGCGTGPCVDCRGSAEVAKGVKDRHPRHCRQRDRN